MRIAPRLLDWYARQLRDLPWRENRDPYRVWVSEVMLQQTRIETVIPYFERFLARFPQVTALAAADVQQVLKLWEGLGYYARARNLHRAAQVIVGERGGRFPDTSSAWRELPGIGAYTAAAIASITRGEAAPVADGNVRRVMARVLNQAAPSAEGVLERLRQEIDPTRPGDFNQAIMELGQTICIPRAPRCPDCPIRDGCSARAADTVTQVPARPLPRRVPHLEIAIGACRRGGRVLVARRPERAMLGGLWEFPGGKIEPGESPEQALAREFREEVGLAIRVGERFALVSHRYTHLTVRLHAFLCEAVRRGPARALASEEIRWVTLAGLQELPFPTANRKVITALEKAWRAPRSPRARASGPRSAQRGSE